MHTPVKYKVLLKRVYEMGTFNQKNANPAALFPRTFIDYPENYRCVFCNLVHHIQYSRTICPALEVCFRKSFSLGWLHHPPCSKQNLSLKKKEKLIVNRSSVN